MEIKNDEINNSWNAFERERHEVRRQNRKDGDDPTFLSMVFSLIKVEIFSSSFEFLSCNSLALDSRSLTYTFFLSRACWAETLFLSNLPWFKKKEEFFEATSSFLRLKFDMYYNQLPATTVKSTRRRTETWTTTKTSSDVTRVDTSYSKTSNSPY